jgi:hypothetical protein
VPTSSGISISVKAAFVNTLLSKKLTPRGIISLPVSDVQP